MLNPLFSEKGGLEISKNYSDRTVTAIPAQVYYRLLLLFIQPEVEKILGKNKNFFRRNRPTISHILTIRRIIEGARAKKSWGYTFCSFL